MTDKLFGVGLLSVGLVMLLHMAAPREARGEGAKCANNTCKEIDYYYNCAEDNNGVPYGGIALKNKSCLFCTNPPNGVSGRCDGGTGDTCTDSNMPNPYATSVNVTKSCDCQAGWGAAGGNVEAVGAYIGDYSNPANLNIFTCKKPS